MPRLPDVSYREAVRALQKAGFWIAHEGKHTIMSNGKVRLTVPRHNPINAFTMGSIAEDAGFSPEEFKRML